MPWLAAAASLLLIVAVAVLYRSGADAPPLNQLADISAGGNRATLMLAGGQPVRLDSSQRGGRILSSRLLDPDSTLDRGLREKTATGEDGFTKLTTTRVETYQVELTEVPKVW